MAKLTELPVNSIRGVSKPTETDNGKAMVYSGSGSFSWVLVPTSVQLNKLDGIEDGAQNNTGAHVGAGAPVFAGKSGSQLRFRGIKPGTGVNVSYDGSDITVSAIPASNGGATAFLGLTDVPTSYVGQEGRIVRVNAAGTGLEFADAGGAHTHEIADVSGLQAELDGKQPLNAVLTGFANVGSVSTGRILYTTGTNAWTTTAISTFGRSLIDDADAAEARTTLGAAAATHTHATSDVTGLDTALAAKVDTVNFTWTNLSGKPSTFTPAAHTHAISDVTNLQSSLDAKVATSRTVSAGTGLTGGGDLSANRTISADIATAANVRAATANKLLDAAGVLSAVTPVALTDAATITPDFNAGRAFTVTLAGNRTLANPTNLAPGQSGLIVVTQDATGSRTLSYGSYWKFPGGAPTLTTAAAAVDLISYYVVSSSQIICSIVKDVK